MKKKQTKLTLRVTDDGLLTYAEDAGARCAVAAGSVGGLRKSLYDQIRKDIDEPRPEPRTILVNMADVATTLDELQRWREASRPQNNRDEARG